MKSNNPYTEPGWEKALERLGADPLTADEFGNLTIPICDLAAAIRTLHARLRTAKAEGAEEAYGDIKEQAEDLRKEGGIRASLLRLLTEECVSRAAAIRKGIEAKEGK